MGDLRRVLITICQPCLDGVGQECHTPGCALWMHRVDLPIDPVWYEVVASDDAAGVAAGPQATPGQVLGYVVLSDHVDRSTGKPGIDLNWDGELHPTRDAAEESAADARDESSDWWVEIGAVTLPADLVPEWVVAVPTDQEDPT